ncbi:MAG: glycosyltransferase [Clostridia bacterium]|nr:glycosyltransferase [Clostridia bacterium]MDD4048381.1 glycosyltransferase [Clostridia bacterium]
MERKKPIRALIFSVSIGNGHDSVANAVEERLQVEAPGSEVKIVDTFRYINSVLNKVVVGSYMETLKLTPKVWGYLYEQAGGKDKLVDTVLILAKILSHKIVQLIKDVNPQIIIMTHAFPAGMLGEMKLKGKIQIPMVAAVTDFHVHSIWINQGIDMYFIQTADLALPLIQEGIKDKCIKPLGIPIRMQFGQNLDHTKLKDEMRLGGEPIVLVMGGGLGLGRIEVITRKILSDEKFRVVVVAGKNNRLYDKLTKWNNPRLKVFGFVEDMARIIAACDIVLSKPGGVTTAEVLALGKPLAIYSSLPGQEDENSDYLLNKGVAVKIKKIDMLVPELLRLWQNPLRLRHMKEMAKYLGSPHASELFWDNVWQLLEENKD